MSTPLRLLTVAGSDSGGAAGMQADLKSFAALGAYGMCALTAVTAQNSLGVDAVHRLPPELVASQLRSVLSDYGADGVKTGFIGAAALVAAIAQVLRAQPVPVLVVDPVLVNRHARPMFAAGVVAAYRQHLLPLATLLSPNRAEAALLADRPVDTPTQMADAGRELLALGPGAVLVTGGRDGAAMVDVLVTPDGAHDLPTPFVDTPNTHGSGDTLSAAALVFLARGLALPAAVAAAQRATASALRAGAQWRLGAGHGPLAHGAMTGR